MIPAEMIEVLRNRGVDLWVEGGRLRYAGPPDVIDQRAIAYLQRHRDALVNLLHAEALWIGNAGRGVPLSKAQERLWFLQQLAPDNPFLNVVGAIRVRGSLEPAHLEKALSLVAARHPQMRAAIDMLGETPIQVNDRCEKLIASLVESSRTPARNRHKAIAALAEHLVCIPFDLQRAPLVRFAHLRFASDDHGLILVMHHIICDFWSIGIIVRDLLSYLSESEGNRPPLLPPLPCYADVVQGCFPSTDIRESIGFWQENLTGYTPVDLPCAKMRPARKSFLGDSFKAELSASSTQPLGDFARALGTTPFCVLIAAFASYLQRSGAGNDLVIGTDVAGRSSARSENVVGFFVNQVALRFKICSNETFVAQVENATKIIQQALVHQNVPFQQVVEIVGGVRDLSRHPIFDIAFTLHDTPAIRHATADAFVEIVDVPNHSAQFDLEVVIEFEGPRVLLSWRYSTDLLTESVVAAMSRGFERFLAGVLTWPQSPISQVSVLSESDLAEIYRLGSRPNHDSGGTVVQALEVAGENFGGRCAIVDGTLDLTYQELLAYVEKYSQGLLRVGIRPGDVVAVMLKRGTELLIAMLGAFRIGAVYMPVDPAYPTSRVVEMLRRSGCNNIVHPSDSSKVAAALCKFNVHSFASIAAGGDVRLPERPLSKAPAYIIFTSGSTGEPRGAVVSHAGMLNHVIAKIENLSLGEGDTCLQTAPQGFDISVWQFLACLLVGGRVVVFPDEVANDPGSLLVAAAHYRGTVLQTVPSMLTAILSDPNHLPIRLPDLRWLISTGEAISSELVQRWLERFPTIPIVNAYGPAECSDDVTHAVIRTPLATKSACTPIGKPIKGACLLVVNEHLEPVPLGTPGELLIAGLAVGCGYVNDPAATACAFIPDFFSGAVGTRCYRTGDLVRWNTADELEFMSRRDNQVKLRGMRADLSEVEAAILRCKGCRSAVVTPLRNGATISGIVAYVVLYDDTNLTENVILGDLQKVLPAYMVPTRVLLLPEMPTNSNGKIDRAALPHIAGDDNVGHEGSLPRSAIEILIAGLWAELLEVPQEKIKRESNFFLLGGHSILATRLVRKLQNHVSFPVPLQLIFEQAALASFAERLQSLARIE